VQYTREEKFIKKFGSNLRKIRKEKGFSLEELAYQSELEYSQVSRIERGIINTSISHAFKLAKALGVEPKDLFDF
jgi:transcriptional regulator with XRE-family HTH domain